MVLGLVLAAAGCGGGSGGSGAGDRPPAASGPTAGEHAAREPRPVSTATRCLKQAGFRAGGGPVHQPHTDAPDQELVASKGQAFPGGTAVFVAYYQAAGRAEQLAPRLRVNAKRFHGSVQRYGRVSFVWTRAPSAGIQADVERCVFR